MSKSLITTNDYQVRVRNALPTYIKFFQHSVSSVGVGGCIRTVFPKALPDSKIPTFISVEFTNGCNLRCSYCRIHTDQRQTGFMNDDTFDRLIENIKSHGIKRVRVVGNGEATTHPKFNEYIKRLAEVTPYLQLKTNGIIMDDKTIDTILSAPVKQVGISVDSDRAEEMDAIRGKGSFDKVLNGVKALNEARNKRGHKTLININVMMRPSNKDRLKEIHQFWGKYADSTNPTPVLDYTGLLDDVFSFATDPDNSPHCAIMLKDLEVHFDGNVPLCAATRILLGEKEDFSMGNINTDSLNDMWNGEVMSKYRHANRKGTNELREFCIGCPGF